MRFTPELILEFLLDTLVTGSVDAAMVKMMLCGFPTFNNLPPICQNAIVSASTISNNVPMTEQSLGYIDWQQESLFQQAKKASLSTRVRLPRRAKEDSPWWKDYLSSDEIQNEL